MLTVLRKHGVAPARVRIERERAGYDDLQRIHQDGGFISQSHRYEDLGRHGDRPAPDGGDRLTRTLPGRRLGAVACR